MGICFQKLSDHDNAIEAFKMTILADHDSAIALNAIGFSYYIKSKKEEDP